MAQFDLKEHLKTGDNEVTFTFDMPGNRELPTIVGEITVPPKHWWEGTDAQGKKRNIAETTLEIPLGSGPYRVKEFVAGRTVTLERVKDYWGANQPTQIGTIPPQLADRCQPGGPVEQETEAEHGKSEQAGLHLAGVEQVLDAFPDREGPADGEDAEGGQQ